MNEGDLDTTVVIPTYNGKEVLRKTLEGILCQDYPKSNYEVIVVDDGSTDGTYGLFEARDSEFGAARGSGFLRYIRLPENRGRATARNVGIRRAKGDVIIFLDGDNVPCRNLVEEHVRAHRRSQDIVAVGNVKFSRSFMKSRFVRFWNSRYVGSRGGVGGGDLPFYFPGTSNGSIKRGDLIEVGGFDESFRVYGGEDEELWYRLCVKRGLRNVFLEDALSYHIDPGFGYQRSLNRMRIYGRFSTPIILKKHPHYFDTGIFIRNLEPISFGKDKLKDILRKAFFILATSPPWIGLIEWVTRRFEFDLRVPFPQAFYGLVLCRYYRLGVRGRKD